MNYLMYLFCLLVWGLNFIAVKIQGNEVSLEVSLFLRSLIAFVLFLILFKYRKLSIAEDTNWITAILFGICNFAASYLLLYYGTFFSSAAIVTLIFSMKSVITPLLMSVTNKTKVARKVYIGGFISLLGISIIIAPDLDRFTSMYYTGIILAFVGTIITSIGDVLSSYNSRKHLNPVVANTIGMGAASIVLAIIIVFTGKSFNLTSEVNYWGGLLYLAIFASFLAWLFYLNLVKNIGAVTSSYMVALFPAIGGIASVLMGEEPLTIYLIIGVVVSMTGAFIALFRVNKVTTNSND